MSDRKRYLEKIKKLLSLAKSSNANEAAVALSRAQTMMRKHDIELSDIMLSEVGSSTTPVNVLKPPQWVIGLMDAIESAFGVESVITSEFDEVRFKRKGAIRFIGIRPNDEISAYCFDVLYRQLLDDRKLYIAGLHRNCKKSTKTVRADWYCLGWISEVQSKVRPLAVPGEQKVQIAAWKEKNLDLRSYTAKQTKGDARYLDAYFRGKKDGSGVSMHAGMAGQESRKLTALG